MTVRTIDPPDDSAPFAVDFEQGGAPYSKWRDEQDQRERDAVTEARKAQAAAKTLAEHVSEMARSGAVVRLSSGIPTLDEVTRGGLPVPRFVVLGGAPGVGKTSIAAWLAFSLARRGVFVGMLQVDEGPEGIVDRTAVRLGCRRDRLDAGDTVEWAKLATAVQDMPLVIDDGSMTIEAFAAHVRSRAGADSPAVLISDSLQTVRAEVVGDGREGRREQVDRVVHAHKRVSVEHRLLVIATCELSRAYYRSEALAKELNPLAAFKETGSIEYAAQTAIVLTNPKDHGELVDVTIAKHRGYPKPKLRLQLQPDLTYVEVARPDEGDADDPKPLSAPLERAKREIVLLLGQAADLSSKEAVYRRIHGSKGVKVEALKELIERRTVVEDHGVFRLASEVQQ